MFRFLIVEDDEDLLEELGRAFARWFPDSKIATAFAIDKALQLIEDARSASWSYDAAILDMKLPKQRGLGDEVDDALCCRIREIMNQTLVIHITGHVRDEKVLENLTNFHQHPSDPRSILIDKNNVKWMDELKKTAGAYLYGSLVYLPTMRN
jgi:DNA-binding response OmpR family regulator